MGGRLHRNSQKRIYIEGASYFLTTVTHQRYPFFAEPILCELLVYDLWFASSLKNFRVHGYAILPDHLHLLITPHSSANISVIMHNIKRNVSHNANIVMGFISLPGEDNYLHLHGSSQHQQGDNTGSAPYYHGVPNWKFLKQLRERFRVKYPQRVQEFPLFRWQYSFHDHYIRNRRDFDRHLHYINENAVKHGLARHPEEHLWTWCEGMGLPSTLRTLIHNG